MDISRDTKKWHCGTQRNKNGFIPRLNDGVVVGNREKDLTIFMFLFLLIKFIMIWHDGLIHIHQRMKFASRLTTNGLQIVQSYKMSALGRYKLSKTNKGCYIWEDLNKDRISYVEIEIKTWKGVYTLNILPTSSYKPYANRGKHFELDPYGFSTLPIRLYIYREFFQCVTWHPVKKIWIDSEFGEFNFEMSQLKIHHDIVKWIEEQPPQPEQYKLIKTSDGYRWHDGNRFRGDGQNIEIHTWKGVFKMNTYPPKLLQTNYALQAHRYEFCPFAWYGYTMKVNTKIWHPIQHKWVLKRGLDLASITNMFKRLYDDIIAWIEAQPPQPDYEQAAKDRVEVAQTFAKFARIENVDTRAI